MDGDWESEVLVDGDEEREDLMDTWRVEIIFIETKLEETGRSEGSRRMKTLTILCTFLRRGGVPPPPRMCKIGLAGEVLYFYTLLYWGEGSGLYNCRTTRSCQETFQQL